MNDQRFCKRHESYALNLFCFGHKLPISIYNTKKPKKTAEQWKQFMETVETVKNMLMYTKKCTFTYYHNDLFRLRAKAEDDMG